MNTGLWIIIAVISTAVISLGVWVWFLMGYKHRVTIKELVKGRKSIIHDRARDFKDKEGVSWWKLQKEKNKLLRLIPIPPSGAIELDKKGRKCIEAYRLETGEIVYIEDRNTEQKIDLEALQPLTTKQRLILINNIERAQKRRGKTLLENLPMLVGIGAIVVLIIALLVFWGDLAKPVLEARTQQIVMQELQKEQLEIIKDIKGGVQRIEGENELLQQRLTNIENKPPN